MKPPNHRRRPKFSLVFTTIEPGEALPPPGGNTLSYTGLGTKFSHPHKSNPTPNSEWKCTIDPILTVGCQILS